MNELDYLNRILKIDPDLNKAYSMARNYYYFNHYWFEYSKDEAKEYIKSYIDDLIKFNNPAFNTLAITLSNWIEEISNSFLPYIKHNKEITRLSNGRIEGKNSYIKKMIRLANGYSNFDRFRNRVMYCENKYDTYSEERLPNTIKRHTKKKKDQ